MHEAGENETLAARALLETRALDGLLVSGDAMHAHEGTAQVILERGGDYLLALKANRPAMLRQVETFFADPPEPLDAFETTDADHGRIETRRHPPPGNPFRGRALLRPLPCRRAPPPGPRHPRLRRDLTHRGRPHQHLHPLLPLIRPPHTPEAFARAVRAHWAIENRLHWVLDVTFDEDRARNRRDNGPENLAVLRRFTLNLLNKAKPRCSVPASGGSGGG